MPDIIKGDCIEEMKKLPAGSIDLIISDYPFNCQDGKKDYISFIDNTAKEFYRLLKSGGNLVVINNPINIVKTSHCYKQFGHRSSIALIRKGSFGCNYHYRFQHNYALILYKDNYKKWNGTSGLTDKSQIYNGKPLTDVIEYQNGFRRFGFRHMQALPETLVEMFIKTLSNKGDWVLDPFAGSGTTVVVAEKLGRPSINIEYKQEYIDLIQLRLNEQLTLKI